MTDTEIKMIKKLIAIRCGKKTAEKLIKDLDDVFKDDTRCANFVGEPLNIVGKVGKNVLC